jgi:hypothetical protein
MMMRCAGHVASMERRELHTKFWWEKRRGKMPTGRPRRMWEEYIKTDLRERGWDDMDWINMAQDRVQC